jgi:hypothetical protein
MKKLTLTLTAIGMLLAVTGSLLVRRKIPQNSSSVIVHFLVPASVSTVFENSLER